MVKTKNIVISGTNFWNPGDDFVRDGVIRILHELFPDYLLNFLFYNFNQDFFPQSKFSGVHNMASKGDLDQYHNCIDSVVIAGLSAGEEIKDLYNWIIDNNLTDKVYLIGAGYENDYVAEHIIQEPELTIFKNAKIITSRTKKAPPIIKQLELPYHYINCPAILSVPEVKKVIPNKKIERIAFSVQLPHELGILNHSCGQEMYLLSIQLISELTDLYDIEVIAHHKSEYFHFLNLFKTYNINIPVIFSSYYQDLFDIYSRYDLMITTRLHASLFANGFGIPGIILNDTDRHTHCLDGFPHSVWVNSKEKFYNEFEKIWQKNLFDITAEAEMFKRNLLNKYVNILSKPFGVYEPNSQNNCSQISEDIVSDEEDKNKNYTETVTIKSPMLDEVNPYKNDSLASGEVPLHFFTIVLNGMPFIKYHIDVFKNLPFEWHWHIIEGVADLKNDTAWSVQNGGHITEEFHNNGLSNDGTTEYLDELKKQFPGNITIYRKERGRFWNGKLEMVNAPLTNMKQECILWEIDSDELWTAVQLIKGRQLYINNPNKTASYYLCSFFVGEKLLITSIDTYGNHTDYEWLRTWRYKPGDKWISHEPPKLCRLNNTGEWTDIGRINPFNHFVTKYHKLVFQHYAYVLPEQLMFKEKYYGYNGALNQWNKLQVETQFPVMLRDYFSWVTDEAVVDNSEKLETHYLAEKNNEGWVFNYENEDKNSYKKILFLRTDSIGDNVLASSMLEPIHKKYPEAEIIIICQEHIAELYENVSFVHEIISFDRSKLFSDESYKYEIKNKLQALNVDILLNTVYSREAITDEIVKVVNANVKIGFYGDSSNIKKEELEQNNLFYTHLIDVTSDKTTELEKYEIFLNYLGITNEKLSPSVFIDTESLKFADEYFSTKKLNPEKTISLFPFTQWSIKDYENFTDVLSSSVLEGYNFILLGGKENLENAELLSSYALGRVYNLVGKTTLLQSAAIIKKSKLLIGSDTSGAHIACAVNTQNVVLMGGGHFGRFFPYSELTSLVTLPLNCYGCNWKCKYEKAFCVKDIDYKLILTAVENTLKGIPDKSRIYFNELSGEEVNNTTDKIFSKFLILDKVELIELKKDEVPNQSQDLLLLGEKAINSTNLKDEKEFCKNVLLTETHNIDELNKQAVKEILNKNWRTAADLLEKVISVEAENKIALKNLDYVKQFLKLNNKSVADSSLLKISVITPSFNQSKYIEQTIQSVLDQNYPNFEHIIIDGGSTDGTIEILKKYSHLKWVSEKDKGQSDALNKGFEKATGDIIAWINSDDWYEPNTFFSISKFFNENQYKNVVMGDCNLVDENGKIFDRVINYERGLEELKNYKVSRSIPTQPAVFFRKKMFKRNGFLDVNLEFTMDYDLWMRFARKNRFFHINQPVANYRFHKDAKIGDMNWEKIYPECEIVKEKHYMGEENPLVSVIIPCYNYAEYLPDAVNSVINQTYKNWEILIVNDGSTDNSEEVATQLISSNSREKIRLINQENSGNPAVSRNHGIAQSDGEYILPLDADDILTPGTIKMYIDELKNLKTKNGVIYAWLKTFGVTSNLWETREFQLNELLHKTMLPYCSMFHRSVWQRQNGYATNVGYEDWDFWIGAAENGAKFFNIPQITTLRRETENISRQVSDRKKHELNIAGIIKNHKSSYEEEEIKWAENYLVNYLMSSSFTAHQSSKEKYPAAAAILIYHYPELYEKDEIEWAKKYLADNPFAIKRGIKGKNSIKGNGISNQDLIKRLVNQGVDNLNNNLNDEAIENFDEALKFAPQLPEIKYGKAVALANTGEIEKAKNELDELLKIKPDYTFARQLLTNINSNKIIST